MVFFDLSVSKSLAHSASAAVMIADDDPPGMMALRVDPSRMPPQYSSSSALKVMPMGASNTPVFFTWPLTANRRVPPFFGTSPMRLYSSPPRLMIGGRLASVSTLLTAVGCLKRPPPALAGKGGLRRG